MGDPLQDQQLLILSVESKKRWHNLQVQRQTWQLLLVYTLSGQLYAPRY
jgi:hypothetical protein